MTDIPFGLESKSTYAALSPADLQSLGKRASIEYLSGGTSLNDAIVKLARGLPSISTHQIQRVIEFANQETFARLFADNEKYASDKNIDFPVADPGAILLEINNGALSQTMSVSPDDYYTSPVKLGHSSLEADAVLTRMFLGVDPDLPGSEKLACVVAPKKDNESATVDRILTTMPKQASSPSSLLDRILSTGQIKNAGIMSGIAPQAAMPPQAAPQVAPQQPPGGGDNYNGQMLELQREIELAKKRQELQKVQQQTIDAMNPQGQPGEATAPAPGMPDAGAAGAPVEEQQAPQEAAPGPVEQQIPPAAAGAITAPPGSMGAKMAQVMNYIKGARPHSSLLVKAAEEAFSLESLKQATAHRGEYPMANPYGGVIRAKQKLAMLLDEAIAAKGKNEELRKEASDRFQRAVAKHLQDKGNLAEVAHLMSGVCDDTASMKTALASVIPELFKRGIDLVKVGASSIQYEMEKGASTRVPNLAHPIAQTYSDLLKLSEGAQVLDIAHSSLMQQYGVAEKALQEGMLHASAC